MKYPSVYVSALADVAERYEKDTYGGAPRRVGVPAHWNVPERIEHVADIVERAEEPLETRLDWVYERVTAYRRLQETEQELKLVKQDRQELFLAHKSLAKSYREKTGEPPPEAHYAAVRAAHRAKMESIVGGLRKVLTDIRYKSRG